MNQENLPKSSDEQYQPNLDAEDEEVASGGNNRLVYILVAVLVALVIGYVALPKGQGSSTAAATPSFLLDDAAVTAKVPTAADSVAAGLKTVADGTATEVESKSPKSTTKPNAATQPSASSSEAEPATATAVAPAAAPTATPEPTPAAAPAAPEPAAAPASVTMTGKIEDENGRPLVGATVLLKGSSKGTSTDANGNYSLEVPAGNDNTLVYGYGGYDDEVVRSRGSQPVNVTLTPREKASRKRR